LILCSRPAISGRTQKGNSYKSKDSQLEGQERRENDGAKRFGISSKEDQSISLNGQSRSVRRLGKPGLDPEPDDEQEKKSFNDYPQLELQASRLSEISSHQGIRMSRIAWTDGPPISPCTIRPFESGQARSPSASSPV